MASMKTLKEIIDQNSCWIGGWFTHNETEYQVIGYRIENRPNGDRGHGFDLIARDAKDRKEFFEVPYGFGLTLDPAYVPNERIYIYDHVEPL